MAKREYRVTLTYTFDIAADSEMEALAIAESMIENDVERYNDYEVEGMGYINVQKI